MESKKEKYQFVEITIKPQNKEENEKLKEFLNSRSLFFPGGTKIDDFLNSKEFLSLKEGSCKFLFADRGGIGFIGVMVLYEEGKRGNRNFAIFTNTFDEFKKKYLENFPEKIKKNS